MTSQNLWGPGQSQTFSKIRRALTFSTVFKKNPEVKKYTMFGQVSSFAYDVFMTIYLLLVLEEIKGANSFQWARRRFGRLFSDEISQNPTGYENNSMYLYHTPINAIH